MDENIEKLMKILTDDYAIKILVASYSSKKSAIELSQELNVPIAACYRRLHALQSLGLMDVEERVNQKGKRIKYYNSRIKKANIRLENNQVVIEIVDRGGNKKVYRGKIVQGYVK